MNIIDHLSVGVPDLDRACDFYDPIMEAIGCACLAKTEHFAAYGTNAVQFLIMTPSNGDAYTAGNGTHICFVAKTPDRVDAFHAEALRLGGTDEGSPGPRPGYPKADVYTAFVRDPFGNKLEVIHNGFSVAA